MTDRPSPACNPDLRRRHRRVSLLWSGSLQSADRAAPCAILNLSDGGAKLRLAEPGPCPSRIELDCVRFGRLPGRVIWRKGDELGLAFLEAPKAAAEALRGALLRLAPLARA